MMQQTSSPAADRRRANFLGSQRLGANDHDSSYEHLRAELGEENAARLITNIGTLAMTSGIETSGVSLSDAVKRIIGSLTPAERSAIASGSAPPPRVQALLDSEVKAAQQQRQQQIAAANTTGEDGSPGHKNGLSPLAFAAMDRDLRGRTARSSEYSDLRSDSISSANYSSSQYARTGLNYATFSDLRNQGFNGQQIMAAVTTTKALGIDANRNAAPMARVQRDIPSAVPGLHTTRDNWTAVKKMEEEQRSAQEAGNTAGAEALARRIEEARKHAEEHDKREHERVQRERPDRAPDHKHLQDETRRAALRHEATLGTRNDANLPDRAARHTIQSGITPANRAITAQEGQVIQTAAASELENQQTRTNLASRFGPAPDATPQPTPTKHAAAEPPAPPVAPAANPPTAAPIKTADATPTPRPQANTPRMASPTARA